MGSRVLQADEDKIVVEITISKNSNFLEFEEQLQGRLSEAGRTVTERALADFDADGFPFFVGNKKFTAKRKRVAKKYETPFATVHVERFAYQSSGGGRTHIPFEQDARIIGNATPRLATLISSKYSHCNSGVVQEDLRETPHREAWMEDRCHRLKHEHGAVKRLLKEIAVIHAEGAHSLSELETIGSLLGYMKRNLDRTNYASYRKSHVPNESGVTEAACKTVVKQRMRGSGMKWKHSGAATVLRLRSKRPTKGAWEAFWTRVGLIGL